MSPELDEKLCHKYPLLYRDRHASMRSTCMCWGFGVGDGWYKLLNRLSKKLERLIEQVPSKDRKHCKASQVKEKYGGLRFYMTASTDEMEEAIKVAEKESFRTCESCGEPGALKVDCGWVTVRCGSCE